MDSPLSVPTYRLETFGKLALTGATSAGVSHQRRRLALLALLAAAGKSGLSRDQLIGYLWPESSSTNGRHSLEQLLHGMRRGLGESVFTGTNPVALNFDVITSDVGEFEDSIERGSLADAVAVVSGPFLQGFYLEDAPEFERWASIERSRLSHRYEEILGKLAAEAESAGDYAGLLRWRRRLVEVDPVGSRPALALMRALVASGDRTAALQHARIYEAVVRQELDSGPDPSIVAYAAELRAGAGDDRPRAVQSSSAIERASPVVVDPLVAQAATPSLGDTVFSLEPYVAPERAGPRAVDDTTKPVAETRARGMQRWWIGGILFVAALITLGFTLRNRAASSLDSNRIVVVPFRIAGTDSSVNYLGEGIVDLIAPMMTGEGGPGAVDSRTAISTWNRLTRGKEGTSDDARAVGTALGAGLVLSGSVVQAAGNLTITGSVISTESGDARQLTSVTAPADSINSLLNRFVGQVLARQSGVAEMSLSAVTSQSVPAIRAYLSGRAAYRRADEKQAIESFTRALDLDSTFALAALDLVVATGKLVRNQVCRGSECRLFSVFPGFASTELSNDLFDRAVTIAWQYRSRLGKRDLPLLEALRGENYPRESSARQTLAGLTRAVAAAPDRPETHYLLGVLLLYQGRALGIPDSPERAATALHAASKLDSSYLGPLARLVELDVLEGKRENLTRDASVYLSYDKSGPTSQYVRWMLAAGTGDLSGQRSMRAQLRSMSQGALDQIFITGQMSGLGLDDVDSVSGIISDNATDPIEKSVSFRRAQLLALNRGRPSLATKLLRRTEDLRTPTYTFPQFAIAAALFADGDRAISDSSSRVLSKFLKRDTVGVLSPNQVRIVSAGMSVQALWYLDKGDTASAMRAGDWVRRHSAGQPRNRVLAILPEMMIASRARRASGAPLRALVDSVSLDGCCQIPDFVIILLAQAYEDSGDDASALRIIRRGKWYLPPRQLSTFLRSEGRLSARLGDRSGAIRAYEQFLALRANPEPSLRLQTDTIKAELNRLKGVR